jgi:hypothetical protein
VAQQLPIASTNFYEVVFDLLKIVCGSVHGLFAKFRAKKSVGAPRNPSKLLQITYVFEKNLELIRTLTTF